MIVNQVTDATTRIIGLMAASVYHFYMTGSRYFGNSHSGSDHDFFVQDSYSARNWLLTNGFTLHMKGSYCDAQTRQVYVHAEANIHVQCVLCAETKNKAQEFIKASPIWFRYLKRAEKKERGIIWNLAFDLATTGKLDLVAPLVETVELNEAEKELAKFRRIRAIACHRNRTKSDLAESRRLVDEFLKK